MVLAGSSFTIPGTDFTAGSRVNFFVATADGAVNPIRFTRPSSGPGAPTTGPGSFVVSNRGADGTYSKKSNAVSVPIGEQITLSSVGQSGSTITVDATGFSTLTVINLFAHKPGGVANLGGLKKGAPAIDLTLVSPHQFTFTRPAAALAGPANVQALNPPFVPYTSSGNPSGGAFTLK